MKLPPAANLTILLAHPAYQVAEELRRRRPDLTILKAVDGAGLAEQAPAADVIVVSGLWRNELLAVAPKLRFVQSISAGTDQYDKAAFRARGVRLASAQGANERAVAEHALAMVLALKRHIHLGRDAQNARHWRPMITDQLAREQEIGGLHAVIVGFGRIGQRVGRLLKAFDCRVTGLRREAAAAPDAADAVRPIADLHQVLPSADMVILTCPLTPETTGLIGREALSVMKRSAVLINVARGKVVGEQDLIAALEAGDLAAAGLDVTVEEPLPAASPLWGMANVLITPHSAGETARYEANIIDLLEENLKRLWRGDGDLLNGIV